MILNNNEIIKKEILPKKSFFFNMTEKLRTAFSVFYLAIGVFFITSSLNSSFWLFSIIGIGVFCNALYVTFFRWIVKYWKLKNNYYVITNQRIAIVEKGSGKVLKYKNLNEIKEVNAEMNTHHFGDIIFGEPESFFGKDDGSFSFFRRRGVNYTEDKYAFLSIENINEIIPLFNEMGLKVNKTFY
ncbi:hypothetical protein J2786_001537 [Chryseobacterium vietnamense]|uniref:Uncharacterized protein n=1 Tax=Chryseobacterium vietnamense TaxID=866785 RepID=A0ACC6J6H3_9FLAO|nr:hypothetical protein [Chryseobacterium vietnamense]MDR6458444.1 hypothetical protein [Chryseobacterium vietnamense]